MVDSALLFLGYSLADWNFKVLFRSLQRILEKSTRSGHVSVQLAPGPEEVSEEEKELAIEYLNLYFREQRIVVFWGSVDDFIGELRRWWKELR